MVRKHQVDLENTGKFLRKAIIFKGQLFVQQSPPVMTRHKKNSIDYNFGARDHICGPVFIFYDILESGEQMSVIRRIL